MRYEKGKSGNPSGRPKGSPNKVKASLVERITGLVEHNLDKLQKDFDSLEPIDRIRAISGLLNYVLPKQQALSPEVQAEAEYKGLEKFLDNCPDEVVEKITQRVLELKNKNDEQE